MDIRALRGDRHSIKAIARLTGFSRTRCDGCCATGPVGFRHARAAVALDPFKAYVKERYESCALSAVRILAEIQPMGYTDHSGPCAAA